MPPSPHPSPSTRGRGGAVALALIATLVAVGAAAQERADLPEIVRVVAPPRLRVGTEGEVRLTFRAPQANVVAVLRAVDDLDGPIARRATSQREFGVLTRAFGHEAGELIVPLSFATAGWKRVTLTLVTDERALSEPVIVEVEAVP